MQLLARALGLTPQRPPQPWHRSRSPSPSAVPLRTTVYATNAPLHVDAQTLRELLCCWGPLLSVEVHRPEGYMPRSVGFHVSGSVVGVVCGSHVRRQAVFVYQEDAMQCVERLSALRLNLAGFAIQLALVRGGDVCVFLRHSHAPRKHENSKWVTDARLRADEPPPGAQSASKNRKLGSQQQRCTGRTGRPPCWPTSCRR